MGVVTWLLAAAVLVLLWAYGRWRHSYWASRGVSTPPAVPFLGHFHSVFSGERRLYMDKFYQKFRSQKFWGVYEFFKPSLIVTDPELLKMIMVKDFNHFVDHRVIGGQKGSIFSEIVGNKKGEEWKALRAIMSPAFTSGKMRGMFHLICEKADNLVSFSLKKAGNNTPVNMKDMFGRFTLDTIGSCAFGIECNCLSDSKSVFQEQADGIFRFSVVRLLRIALLLTLPKVYNLIGLSVNIPEAKFLAELSRQNMEARKTGQKRGDFLDLLLEAQAAEEELSPDKRVLQDNTLVAQSVLFLLAGYGPTASTLESATFLLAKHRQHQQTLRRELLEGVREHGAVTYQGIMAAKFLDACIMDTLQGDMGVETWLLATAVLVLMWAYGKWRHSYWASRGVATPPIVPFLGHTHKFVTGQRRLYIDKFYQRFRGHKFWGLYEFFRPTLMVTDSELIKMITLRDSNHFMDRRSFGEQKGSIMNEMLSNKAGDEWKELRAVMTPAFTSGKMRGMFHLICEKADNLVSFSLKKAGSNTPVNMKDMFGRYTMDTIASCAFGIECNCLSDSKPVFQENAEVFFRLKGVRLLKMAFMVSFPKLYDCLGFKVDTPEVEFFAELSRQNTEARKTGQKRGDFLDLLLEAQASEEGLPPHKRAFRENTLVAQSVMFLIGAYDSTASTLAYAAFLLAKHPQHQQTLRREVRELVREHGTVTYQGIMEAKFLHAYVMETLRLYPPAPHAGRKCTKQYRIPGSNVLIRPGDMVQFPIWSLHHDPQYWPQPEEFRPQRFLPENKGDIHSFTHVPFGMGPRICIGIRFALMEIKVALAHVILAADLKLAPGHEQLRLEDSALFMRPKGVMLMLTPLKKE